MISLATLRQAEFVGWWRENVRLKDVPMYRQRLYGAAYKKAFEAEKNPHQASGGSAQG